VQQGNKVVSPSPRDKEVSDPLGLRGVLPMEVEVVHTPVPVDMRTVPVVSQIVRQGDNMLRGQ
jgi:hypothetical protein